MSWFHQLKAKFLPAQQVDVAKLEMILAQSRLQPTQVALKERISQMQIEQTTLQLSLYVYESEVNYLQALYDQLQDECSTAGITTLNLHVNQKKAPNKASSASLPPTVDAQANTAKSQLQHDVEQQARAEQAPIKKTAPSQAEAKGHPHIQHVVVVASGKGGVGKSTTTVNLALALQKLGLKVGVLDADIYGPSIPTMLGNEGQTPLIENAEFVPLDAYGMPVLSIGHLTGDANTPIAWRGAKATGALMQMFSQTQWPMLDVLLIDMPPGTGDIQLTLAQRIAVSGAVIVTTPQHVALMDAQKGIELFNKVNIPIFGVIENMAIHICENCGHESAIFGHGAGNKLSETYQVPLLGQLPLHACIRQNVDIGQPSVVAEDDAMPFYLDIASKLKHKLAELPTHLDQKRIF